MKHVAIIPARAGSKSIINKNLKALSHTNLVDIAVRAAITAKLFDKIILTTDIETLIVEYEKNRDVSVHKRPPELCLDETAMNPVVNKVCCDFGLTNYQNSFLWLLQPTTPFRLRQHFEDINQILELGSEAVISVNEMGAYHRDRTYTMKGPVLYPQRHTNFKNKQDLHKSYIRNGAFYVVKTNAFLKNDSFFIPGRKTYGYIMDDWHSVNIDGPKDLIMARAIAHAYEEEFNGRGTMESQLT